MEWQTKSLAVILASTSGADAKGYKSLLGVIENMSLFDMGDKKKEVKSQENQSGSYEKLMAGLG